MDSRNTKRGEVIKASTRHLELANIIKSVHEDLRETTKTLGPNKAWEEHLKKISDLSEYAKAMKELAGIWEDNAEIEGSAAESRIKWTAQYCYEYFTKSIYLEKREKENRIASQCECGPVLQERYLPEGTDVLRPYALLDVGSCFNPFKEYNFFDVTAIDLNPVEESVYRGDFLSLPLGSDFRTNGQEIEALPVDYFHCVIFSLLLEYLPSSEQRLRCCKKAYDLLKYEGILVIITPDSQHVGKNAKLMKNWRYTLGKMGFSRIKFEKLRHVTCLVFRKCLNGEISQRWSDIHKQPEMTVTLDIPQDS